jgi:hypothetical protein
MMVLPRILMEQLSDGRGKSVGVSQGMRIERWRTAERHPSVTIATQYQLTRHSAFLVLLGYCIAVVSSLVLNDHRGG